MRAYMTQETFRDFIQKQAQQDIFRETSTSTMYNLTIKRMRKKIEKYSSTKD